MRAVIGARCSNGAGAFVAGAVVLVLVGAGDAPPVLATALDAPVAAIVRLQMTALRVRNRKTNNLFRRPAGLADGLALKEPAPPAVKPRD